MPDFYLNDDDIHKLKHRFNLFRRERKIIHDLLESYAADYRQFSGSMGKRYEYLRKKYISQSPSLTHLMMLDDNILWSTQDISIILGRHITTIIRSIDKLERSEVWCVRLLSIRETTKNQNGRIVNVYRKEIFDLLLDLYEDEYLLRFSQPRRGDNNSAPDIHELRRFWQYMKDFDNFNSHVMNQQKHLPDIPPMSWEDILSLIWHKVFSFNVTTVTSVLFAVCFEFFRRFLGVNVYFAVIPAVIACVCIFLIHARKFGTDSLSNIGAVSVFFMLLWISAALSLNDNAITTKKTKQNIILVPIREDNNSIQFNITHNIPNVKQFLYCISPDITFHSTGFLNQFNPDNNSPYPALIIPNSRSDGIIDIDLKFIDEDDHESNIRHFSFDIAHERFKLNKNFILSLNHYNWVSVYQYKDFTGHENITEISLSPFLFSDEIKSAILHLFYGINNEQPDIEVDFDNLDFYEPYVLFKTNRNYIKFVSSQIIFTDGVSSDIRICTVQK